LSPFTSHLKQLFQSSPARGGGCNTRAQAQVHWQVMQFQSSPARGGGATSTARPRWWLPRSFNPHPPVGAGATSTARPRWWLPRSFNPHPPVGAGATYSGRGTMARGAFQSSPARGGGCNEQRRTHEVRVVVVSILTRPWGRVQRAAPNPRGARRSGFNPHPPVGTGATSR